MTTSYAVVAILGLALITVVTRGFFFLLDREIRFPAPLERALRYAPLAALAAVVAPEIVMLEGHLISTWHDPRLWAAAGAAAWYAWRRTMLGVIVVGLAIFLSLRLGWGW
jgi:branched-subunit amino acid transport protein